MSNHNESPTKLYFKRGGPSPTYQDLTGRQLIAREMERHLVGLMAKDLAEESGEGLLAAMDNVDYTNNIKEIFNGSLTESQYKSCLFSIKERALWLIEAEADFKDRQRRKKRTILFQIIGLSLLVLFMGTLFYQVDLSNYDKKPLVYNKSEGEPKLPTDEEVFEKSLIEIEAHEKQSELFAVDPAESFDEFKKRVGDAGLLMYGNPNAPHRFDLISNFTCGHCADAHMVMTEFISKYKPDQVAVYYHNYPGESDTSVQLSMNYRALMEVSPEVARKFIAFAYKNQDNILNNSLSSDDWAWTKEYVSTGELVQIMKSPEVAAAVKGDMQQALELGTKGMSPVVFLDGKMSHGIKINDALDNLNW